MRADDGRGVRMGREGEDVASTSAADGLSLRMPTRFHPASVKGAAWQVPLSHLLLKAPHPDENSRMSPQTMRPLHRRPRLSRETGKTTKKGCCIPSRFRGAGPAR